MSSISLAYSFLYIRETGLLVFMYEIKAGFFKKRIIIIYNITRIAMRIHEDEDFGELIDTIKQVAAG